MVVHDPQNQEKWITERASFEQEKAKEHPRRSNRWSVLAIQSLACGLVVALVLLLRMAGGAAYEEFRQGFQDALMRNELMSVLSRLWDGEVTISGEEVGFDTVKNKNFTVNKTALLRDSSPIF